MRLRLSQRFNLYIGGILLAGILALTYYDLNSNRILLREIGVGEAERLSSAIFDQLYTSMRLGGGRAENRAIVERFKKIGGIDEIRIIHGLPLDREYGIEEDELPMDALDRAALEGKPGSQLLKDNGSYGAARFVRPIFFMEECRACHNAKVGEVNGALSVTVSLRNYSKLIAGHTSDFFLWGGSILLLTSLAVLLLVQKRLIAPLESLKKGFEALSGGKLAYRVDVHTGDELEEIGRSFNSMAESLSEINMKLRDLSERHSKLVQMAPDGIMLKDMETNSYVDANPAACDLIGYTPEELRAKKLEEIFPPDKYQSYRQVFRRWAHDGKGYLHDAEVINKDGRTVPVEIAGSVLEINGKLYIQEIWRDLAERKGFQVAVNRHIEELESMVRERTSKLNNSLSELAVAYERLKDSEQKLIESAKLASLGEMGAGIAHELNSPLAGILSITEVLLNRMPPEDPNHKLLERIKDAAVRSKYIILDMLTYARPGKTVFEPMFLNETVRATLLLFSSEIKTSSIEIAVDFDTELPKVFGNKGQIMEVILNVLKNARDAMYGNGKIMIKTWVAKEGENEYGVAEIRDTGPGIPQEIADRIFDPFFTTKEKGGGLNIGLGLSIAKSIIKEHGGKIEAESRIGEGAVFRIYVPVWKPVQD